MDQDIHCPILIVGGGAGGVAAALAAARNGQRCVLTEPTDWVGGQLTSQAVPPDENPWIDGKDGVQSATASYLDFRRRIRRWYRDHRNLTPEARDNEHLNPGNGWVSRLCFEPAVGHAVLMDMLGPHLASGLIDLRLRHAPVAADVDGDRVRAVTLRDVRTDEDTTVTADTFIDATELGDLLPLTGAEYALGAEHRDVHGELHGRTDRTDPDDQQGITWCFATEHRPGEDHTLDKPDGYGHWRDYVPDLDPPWPGPLFSWAAGTTDDGGPRVLPMIPWPDTPGEGVYDWWRYRRITDRALYADDAPPDVSLFNGPQMDYFRKPNLTDEVDSATQRDAYAAARQQSLCFFHWMQTEAPRHDGGTGYPGLRLRGDELGTGAGLAKAPYIREARRLVARTVLTEAHLGAEQRRAAGHPDVPAIGVPAAEPFTDSVGIGNYHLDLHPTPAGRNHLYVPAAPYRIPLGSLIPVRLTNLLAGGKNFGVSHIANGCTRLHPVEWNVGEAAGLLAAWCLAENTTPVRVHGDPDHATPAFQQHLTRQGFALAWPWEG